MPTARQQAVLNALDAAGWTPVSGREMPGTAYASPQDAIDRETPAWAQERPNPTYPSPTYRSVTQVIVLGDTFLIRRAEAPWVTCRTWQASGRKVLALIEEQRSGA